MLYHSSDIFDSFARQGEWLNEEGDEEGEEEVAGEEEISLERKISPIQLKLKFSKRVVIFSKITQFVVIIIVD
ncbi:hypothetical protein QVD17_00335 [Tagetes erecta]|uniref:Uncharacterized protein n=1 Tax=Tagetes erecta TaxID=13708 RepID=A0AAD8L7N6_TARER|nr:hypothetical protein QVD17_00335 [Tagetes erecta]